MSSKFMRAAKYGRLSIIQKFISKSKNFRFNINCQNKIGETALIIAAQNKHVKVVKLLIEAGADVNVMTKLMKSALICICEKRGDRSSIAQLFIDAGANDLSMALGIAVKNNNSNIAQKLIDTGRCALSMALGIAVKNNNLNMVQLLINNGVDIDVDNCINNQISCIRYAIRNNNFDMVRQLVEGGANINDFMIVHDVASYGSSDIFTYLWDKGINYNPSIEEISCCLHQGCLGQHYYCALGQHYYCAKRRTYYGRLAPLHYIISNGYLEIFKFIITKGLSVTATNSYGHTLLHYAVLFDHKHIVNYLIEHGADINALDNDQRPPIYYAYCGDKYELMIRLISIGANTDSIPECVFEMPKMRPVKGGYIMNTLKEWRPWNHPKYPKHIRKILKTLVVLAKS